MEQQPSCIDRLGVWLRQVRLLTYKNYLVKRRNCCGTCCEILLPVVVLLLLVAVRGAFKTDTKPDTQYVSPTLVNADGTGDVFSMNQFVYDVPSKSYEYYRVALAPNNEFMRNLTLAMNATLAAQCPGPRCSIPVTVIYPPFESDDAIIAYIQQEAYGKPEGEGGVPIVSTAVVFTDFGGGAAGTTGSDHAWEYMLRCNYSSLQQVSTSTNSYSIKFDSTYQDYQQASLTFLQAFVDQYIINYGSATAAPTYQEVVMPFPIPEHKENDFATTMSGVIPLFFILSYLYPCARIVRNIVEEKEQRIKEGMRMMGMEDSAMWTSWYITYIIQFLITAILVTIIGSASLYEYSSKPLIFFYFWIFGISMISYGAVISTFFSKAKIAGTAAYLFIFGGYVPVFVLGSNGQSTTSYSLSQLTAAGLLPPTAFGLGATQIALFEGYQIGITQDSQNKISGNYKFSATIEMLIVDIFLYGVLSWYLDKVIPSEYGGTLAPWFFLTPSYWCGKTAERRDPIDKMTANASADGPKDTEEPVSDDVKRTGVAVSIKGLRKQFGDFTAVEGMNLDLYKGQILCLLGHNGAGKTTTISMLTGLTSITSGDALIDGYSIREDPAAVRQRIGVCPQHDVLFPTLTVREHLELFAAIKGIPSGEVEQFVTAAIVDVGLTEKEHTLSMELSGGMKRKLSVAIAFAGKSNVVFLDEPTSGMDPYSRRSTWETLSKFKKDRVIILTTHFMDEADILGDRIAIMGHGVVQCVGSSLFLKSLYGVGYTLTFTRALPESDKKTNGTNGHANGNGHAAEAKHNSHEDPLVKLIAARLPGAEKLSSIGAELSYRISLQSAKEFPDLFREVDRARAAYGVVNYGVSVTTLEEVFLKVGRPDQEKGAHHDAKSLMEQKTALQQKAGTMTDDTNVKAEDDELNMALRVEQELNRSDTEVCWRHFKALFMKRVHYAKRDQKAMLFQFAIPLIFLIIGFGVLQISTDITFTRRYYDNTDYNSPLYVPINSGVNGQTLSADTLAVLNSPPSYDDPFTAQVRDDVTVDDFSTQLLATRNEFEQTKYISFYFPNDTEAAGWASQSQYYQAVAPTTNSSSGVPAFTDPNTHFMFLFVNVTAYHSVPVTANIAHNALYRNATGDNSAVILASVQPFPLTARQKEIVTKINGLFAAIITVIAFVFIPASYAVFVVRERETKAKHIQTISGVSPLAYWSSTYAWDLVGYIIPWVGSIIIVAAYNNASFTGDAWGATILSFLFYGLSVAPFTYAMSFGFQSHSTAQTVLLIVYFMTGLLFLIVTFAMTDLISSTESVGDALRFIFRFFPPFALGDSLLRLAIRSDGTSPYDLDVTGWNILWMFFDVVLYSGLTMLFEYVSTHPECQSCLPQPSAQDPPEVEDEDVIEERRLISEGQRDSSAVVIKGLRKVYPHSPPKVAVRNLSFAIEQGQCFGFLGINGAGKTTTLSILSGEFPASSGDAYLMGQSVLTEQEKCRRLIGYCPQFDALLDLLTAREHLEMFARIKGVPEQNIPKMVNTMLNRLTLTEYADRPSGAYSGGNRRKLSVGLALIGNPPIVFLDEPSTGMDPVSRRFMWDFISHTMKGRSVILTTHSMEECEALCSRLGIMVGGRLRCLGTTQHIKDRFGNGYQLDINLSDDSAVEPTKRFVAETFAGARLMEYHGTRLKYTLNMNMPLSAVFERIEANKQSLFIREYSVGQTSLEQIFIDFAKLQNEEKGTIAGLVGSGERPGSNGNNAVIVNSPLRNNSNGGSPNNREYGAISLSQQPAAVPVTSDQVSIRVAPAPASDPNMFTRNHPNNY